MGRLGATCTTLNNKPISIARRSRNWTALPGRKPIRHIKSVNTVTTKRAIRKKEATFFSSFQVIQVTMNATSIKFGHCNKDKEGILMQQSALGKASSEASKSQFFDVEQIEDVLELCSAHCCITVKYIGGYFGYQQIHYALVVRLAKVNLREQAVVNA
uniref:Uncharacterized protein n=1 Tax=Romanomermis culicivorax TaxID=13658 RepID=A0A915L9Z8_ROMCU